jgi:hypothetical protein
MQLAACYGHVALTLRVLAESAEIDWDTLVGSDELFQVIGASAFPAAFATCDHTRCCTYQLYQISDSNREVFDFVPGEVEVSSITLEKLFWPGSDFAASRGSSSSGGGGGGGTGTRTAPKAKAPDGAAAPPGVEPEPLPDEPLLAEQDEDEEQEGEAEEAQPQDEPDFLHELEAEVEHFLFMAGAAGNPLEAVQEEEEQQEDRAPHCQTCVVGWVFSGLEFYSGQ